MKGARRRGRQKKRWEDNIKVWTGTEFGDSLRAAEDRKMWKSSVYVICGAPTTVKVEMRWAESSEFVSLSIPS